MRFKEQSMTGLIVDTKTGKNVNGFEVMNMMNSLNDEIELLEIKLNGLEDIDEDKANLRDIAQRAIALVPLYWVHKELQAELDREMK